MSIDDGRPAVSVPRRRGGLRRQWRTAFVAMASAILLSVGGVTVTYVAMAGRYRDAAHNLNAAIAQTAALDAAVNDHEIQSHKLWQGTHVDRAAFQRSQTQISTLFVGALADLHGTGEHVLVTQASRVWRHELTSRGLWDPGARPRPGGVTGAMQAAYGSAQDQVYFLFGRLSSTAIANGAHDLSVADRFEKIGIGLLAAVFGLVLAIMLYFARRLTKDVVHPVELLQAAVRQLRAGSLEHRIDLSNLTRTNEIDDLAGAFNEMASALHVSHAELARRAAFDALTGLANRASFNERLKKHFSGDDRRSEIVSVLFVDIDDFKFVNDSIGHAAGDALLVSVAERLAASVRPTDFVARLGGDEFAIITLGSDEDVASANEVAERVLQAMAEPFLLGDELLSVAVSIGVSVMRADTPDPASLISEADFAMYSAKRAGKGRSEVFDVTADAIPGPVDAVS